MNIPFSDQFIDMLYRVPVMLVSFTIHELAHGYVSYKQGDPTPKRAGRITLNPIKHIDPIGAILLLFARFGWAKPVPIDPGYYKNKKTGIMLTSFAGPLSNILMASIGAAIFALSINSFSGFSLKQLVAAINTQGGEGRVGNSFVSLSWVLQILINGNFYGIALTSIQSIILTLLLNFITINILLAAFNLIPIPPLDGSKVLFPLLPTRLYYEYILPYERFGMILLIILSFTGILGFILTPFYNAVEAIIISVLTLF